MPTGTGLIHLQKAIPERFYDVGIAEQHAVCFAAGLASQGFKPVAAIYSTFLQRAYDQVIHDVGVQNLPVVFVLDRGGLVGEDGPTHHGAFDLSYLRCIPNMVIMSPKDENELKDMLWTAIQYRRGPIALRYPRGNGVGVPITEEFVTLPIGVSEVVREGREVALLAIGDLVQGCLAAADLLAKEGIWPEVINMRFVKPLDEAQLRRVAKKFKAIVTVEDNVLKGGFGSAVAEFFMDHDLKDFRFGRIGIPDRFIEHGAKHLLYRDLGLDPQGIARTVKETLREADVVRWIGFRRWISLVSEGKNKGQKMEKVE